ncbi:MAG: AmmeMemoRadiSam system protein A [Anaerolineae bacterium]
MQHILNDKEQSILLDLAHEAIRARLENEDLVPPALSTLSPILRENGASFVTLTLRGQLRGCIGSLVPRRPLAVDVQENAIAAAFKDPRFPPLTRKEFEHITVELSVLSQPQPLEYDGPDDLIRKLRPGVDGVVLQRGWNRATFLPQVWKQLPEPEEFLGHLCYKAGLPANAWQWPDLEIETYQVQKFKQPPPAEN